MLTEIKFAQVRNVTTFRNLKVYNIFKDIKISNLVIFSENC